MSIHDSHHPLLAFPAIAAFKVCSMGMCHFGCLFISLRWVVLAIRHMRCWWRYGCTGFLIMFNYFTLELASLVSFTPYRHNELTFEQNVKAIKLKYDGKSGRNIAVQMGCGPTLINYLDTHGEFNSSSVKAAKKQKEMKFFYDFLKVPSKLLHVV